MADASDSKSDAGDSVRVQVPPSALNFKQVLEFFSEPVFLRVNSFLLLSFMVMLKYYKQEFTHERMENTNG